MSKPHTDVICWMYHVYEGTVLCFNAMHTCKFKPTIITSSTNCLTLHNASNIQLINWHNGESQRYISTPVASIDSVISTIGRISLHKAEATATMIQGWGMSQSTCSC